MQGCGVRLPAACQSLALRGGWAQVFTCCFALNPAEKGWRCKTRGGIAAEILSVLCGQGQLPPRRAQGRARQGELASSQWLLAMTAKMLRQSGPAQAPLGGKGKSIRGLLGQMAVRATVSWVRPPCKTCAVTLDRATQSQNEA